MAGTMVRVRMVTGIGREVARDILDELAPAGAEAGGQEDGCQIRTAAAERQHGVARAASQKSRNDHDRVRRQFREDAERAEARVSGRPGAIWIRQPGLVHVDACRSHAARLQSKREERNRSQLTRRPQEIHHSRIRRAAHAACDLEQRIGHALFGRDNDDQLHVWLPGQALVNKLGGASVGSRVYQNRASDFQDGD